MHIVAYQILKIKTLNISCSSKSDPGTASTFVSSVWPSPHRLVTLWTLFFAWALSPTPKSTYNSMCASSQRTVVDPSPLNTTILPQTTTTAIKAAISRQYSLPSSSNTNETPHSPLPLTHFFLTTTTRQRAVVQKRQLAAFYLATCRLRQVCPPMTPLSQICQVKTSSCRRIRRF